MIKADAVIKTGYNDGFDGGCDAVVAVQGRRNEPEVTLDFPNAFSRSSPVSKDRDVVRVTLRMISREKGEKRGFAASVGASDHGVLAGIQPPVEAFELVDARVNDGAVAYLEYRRGDRGAGRL